MPLRSIELGPNPFRMGRNNKSAQPRRNSAATSSMNDTAAITDPWATNLSPHTPFTIAPSPTVRSSKIVSHLIELGPNPFKIGRKTEPSSSLPTRQLSSTASNAHDADAGSTLRGTHPLDIHSSMPQLNGSPSHPEDVLDEVEEQSNEATVIPSAITTALAEAPVPMPTATITLPFRKNVPSHLKPAKFNSVSEILAKYSHPDLAKQKFRRIRPFLRTRFGTLPPEIREEVWKYVCFSQETATNTPLHEPTDLADANHADTLGGALQTSTPARIPCPAILLVCRLIYQETQHIYYANNPFRLNNASSLLGFLQKIRPECCEHITVLHLGGLSAREPTFTQLQIEEICRDDTSDPSQRERLAAHTSIRKHPDAEKAAESLKQCNHLKTVFLHTRVGEEMWSVFFFLWAYGWSRTVIDFLDSFHWVVRRPVDEHESAQWVKGFWIRALPEGSSWGEVEEGNDRLLEVEIALDP